MKKIVKGFIYVFYLTLIIYCCFNDKYFGWNVFEKMFKAPFFEIMFILKYIGLNIKLAYFLTFILGFFTVYPVFADLSKLTFKMGKVWTKLVKISSVKANNTEEQREKNEKMFKIYKEEGISLSRVFIILIFSFLGLFFLKMILGEIFYWEYFKNENWNLFWFDLSKKDDLFILSGIAIALMCVPIVELIITFFKKKTTFDKIDSLIGILITLACVCLLVYSVLFSTTFSLFIISIYSYQYGKRIINIIKNKKIKKEVVENERIIEEA